MSEKITKKFGVFGETEEKKSGYYISVENDQEKCSMNMDGNGTPLSHFFCSYVKVTEKTRDAFKFQMNGTTLPLLPYITKYMKVFVEPGEYTIKDEDKFDLRGLYYKLLYIDGDMQDDEKNAVLDAISERGYENPLTCALSDHVALSIFVPSPDFLKKLDDSADKTAYKSYYAVYNHNMDEESNELIIIGEKYVMNLMGSGVNYMEYSIYCINDFDPNDDGPDFDYAYGLYRSTPLYKNNGIHKLIPIIESYKNKMIKYHYNQYRNGMRFEYAECYNTYAGLKLGISGRINPNIVTKEDGRIGLGIPHLFTLLDGDNSGHILFYYDSELFKEEVIIDSYNSRGEARILSEESTITVDLYVTGGVEMSD